VGTLDELHFGPRRTLNLRESLPTGEQARVRAERWLREQQIQGSKEVLIITGRGSHSIGGVAVVKEAVTRLLRSLKRQGVVSGHREHNPGALVVILAPLRSLTHAAARHGEPARVIRPFDFTGLSDATLSLLRDLADASLAELGVTPDEARVRDEMHRQLRIIAGGLPPTDDSETQLRKTLRAMIAEYD
jgi:Smr domain